MNKIKAITVEGARNLVSLTGHINHSTFMLRAEIRDLKDRITKLENYIKDKTTPTDR